MTQEQYEMVCRDEFLGIKKSKKIVAGEYVEIDQEYEVLLVPFEITEE